MITSYSTYHKNANLEQLLQYETPITMTAMHFARPNTPDSKRVQNWSLLLQADISPRKHDVVPMRAWAYCGRTFTLDL